MYAAGACVILILVIMGVSLFNSFDRMKSVQNTLGFLDKETVAVRWENVRRNNR